MGHLFLLLLLVTTSALGQQPAVEKQCLVVKCSNLYAEKNCQTVIDMANQVWSSGAHVQRKRGLMPRLGPKFDHVYSNFDSAKKSYSWSDLDLLHSAGTDVTIVNGKRVTPAEFESKALSQCKGAATAGK